MPFNDMNPYVMPDAKTWDDLTKNRAKLSQAEHRRNLTEREIEIQKKLKTPVSLQFDRAPLSKVMDYLGKMADVNLHLDPQGLAEEGVTTDTPVTIDLRHEIMLKSALNLILEPLHLSYVIKDEVLKITSEQMRDGQVYPVTYNVADLVMPIPNFVPTPDGLGAAYHNAMGTMGFGGGTMRRSARPATPLAVVASRDGKGGIAARSTRPCWPQMTIARIAAGGPRSRIAATGRLRARRTRRRRAGRLRQPDRPDHLHRQAHHLGRRRRPGLDRPLRDQPEPRRQPDAGRPRGDRRPAGAVAAAAGPAGHDRSPLHHAQRQLLRADRRGLRLRHQRQRQEPARPASAR